jgi:hypothetical protein
VPGPILRTGACRDGVKSYRPIIRLDRETRLGKRGVEFLLADPARGAGMIGKRQDLWVLHLAEMRNENIVDWIGIDRALGSNGRQYLEWYDSEPANQLAFGIGSA